LLWPVVVQDPIVSGVLAETPGIGSSLAHRPGRGRVPSSGVRVWPQGHPRCV